jgi:hypothetical protein
MSATMEQVDGLGDEVMAGLGYTYCSLRDEDVDGLGLVHTSATWVAAVEGEVVEIRRLHSVQGQKVES